MTYIIASFINVEQVASTFGFGELLDIYKNSAIMQVISTDSIYLVIVFISLLYIPLMELHFHYIYIFVAFIYA